MDKWEYIKRISEASDHYGDKLLDLMDKCCAYNLGKSQRTPPRHIMNS